MEINSALASGHQGSGEMKSDCEIVTGVAGSESVVLCLSVYTVRIRINNSSHNLACQSLLYKQAYGEMDTSCP